MGHVREEENEGMDEESWGWKEVRIGKGWSKEGKEGKEGKGEKGIGNGGILRMFDALWVGSPTGNKFSELVYKFWGWERDEEEFKYLLYYMGVG